MNPATIIETMFKIGANLPAYVDLIEQVIATFGEDDQAVLKAKLAEARAASDAAYAETQRL